MQKGYPDGFHPGAAHVAILRAARGSADAGAGGAVGVSQGKVCPTADCCTSNPGARFFLLLSTEYPNRAIGHS